MIEVIAIIISGITLLITIINQIIIIKDKEPQLSFSLKNYDNILYLMVINNGLTKARNVRVKIEKIYNNGNHGIQEDAIFEVPFELASTEKVQGMIGILGENISTHVFPYIDITVSYEKEHFRKKIRYERQVFYTAVTENNITVNTGLNLQKLEKHAENIHKSTLRLANYFDGNEIAPFDELNIISNNHFQKDLLNAKNEISSEIKCRKEIIDEMIGKWFL